MCKVRKDVFQNLNFASFVVLPKRVKNFATFRKIHFSLLKCVHEEFDQITKQLQLVEAIRGNRMKKKVSLFLLYNNYYSLHYNIDQVRTRRVNEQFPGIDKLNYCHI